jgi:hypothetical protein
VFYLLLLREANDGVPTIPTVSPSFSSYAPPPQPDHLQGPLARWRSRKRPLPRPDTSPPNMGGTEVKSSRAGEDSRERMSRAHGRQAVHVWRVRSLPRARAFGYSVSIHPPRASVKP